MLQYDSLQVNTINTTRHHRLIFTQCYLHCRGCQRFATWKIHHKRFPTLKICHTYRTSVKLFVYPVKSLSALPTWHYKWTCQPISTLTLLNAERQAGKLRIPTFKVLWSDLTRKDLQTTIQGKCSNYWATCWL